MTIQDFILMAEKALAERLAEQGTEDIGIESAETLKPNDTRVHGLSLRRRDDISGRYVYLDDLFYRLEEGEDRDRLIQEAADRCMDSLSYPAPPVSQALDLAFESVRDRLFVRLLGVRNNISYMADRPYIDAGCGLALAAVISLDGSPVCEWAISVTHDLLAQEIGCDRETLLTAALENTMRKEPPYLASLSEQVYANLSGSDDVTNYLEMDEIGEEHMNGAFMLSNRSGFQGASALFYPGMMERVANLLGGGYYVLPSSVHELIILPDEMAPDVSQMKDTVREANATVIGRDELLSWNVFHYDPADGELRIAKEEQPNDFVVIEKRKCDNIENCVHDAAY